MSCPICDGDTQQRYRPFCSRRCADRDLGKWLNGSYAVPSQRLDDVDGEADESEREPLRSH
ncbi:DNA gyrase inhibitor YacG [Sedimentitalea sp.]|uniref:DNA gyrase inhibitor YacG n=1 Tax=Sedimentitalea sp. TaxID=2048915 RepID=UPI003298E11B